MKLGAHHSAPVSLAMTEPNGNLCSPVVRVRESKRRSRLEEDFNETRSRKGSPERSGHTAMVGRAQGR
jgi:hypothetical protein